MEKNEKRRFFWRKIVFTLLVCTGTVFCAFLIMLFVDKKNFEKTMKADEQKLAKELLVYDTDIGDTGFFYARSKEILADYSQNDNAQLKYAALFRTVKINGENKNTLLVTAKEAVPLTVRRVSSDDYLTEETKFWCENEEFISWLKEEQSRIESEKEPDLLPEYTAIYRNPFEDSYYLMDYRVDLLTAYVNDRGEFIPGLFSGDALENSAIGPVASYDEGNVNFTWLAEKSVMPMEELRFKRGSLFLIMNQKIKGVASDSPVFTKINEKCEFIDHEKRFGDVEVILESDLHPKSCTLMAFAYTNVIEDNAKRYTCILFIVGLMSAVIMALSVTIQYQGKKNACRQEVFRKNLMNNLAHDLRTPLAVISGYAQNLCDGVSPEKEEHYIKAIKDNTDYMDSIIDNVMSLSESESSKIKLNKERFDAVSLAEEIWKKNEALFEEQKLTLKCEGTFEIEADRWLMTSVLENLVVNAMKYSKEGAEVEIVGNGRTFSVSNPVSQMPQISTEELWEPFVKGDDSRGKRSGSGLGLSIVKSILDIHGFKAEIACENGVFKVRIIK